MIGLLQRVTEARVSVEDTTIAAIGSGLLVMVGIVRDDDRRSADRLLARLLSYRIFADENGRMNRNLVEVGGGLLLVPQFTLAADTRKGNRPSFTRAADPQTAQRLFHYLAGEAEARVARFGAGRFGADMQVSLINDGPVTFWLQTRQGGDEADR